jgi:hypothetical protein
VLGVTQQLLVSRRSLLRAAGVATVGAPLLWSQTASAGAPPAEQVHLTFGADAARTMTVSWVTPAEQAPWWAMTDPVQAFGFASFDVDPGTTPGGLTRMNVTAYRSPLIPGGKPTPYDVFTLQRKRSDG